MDIKAPAGRLAPLTAASESEANIKHFSMFKWDATGVMCIFSCEAGRVNGVGHWHLS